MANIRSFRELQEDIMAESDLFGDEEARPRIRRWINESDQSICETFDFPELNARWRTTVSADEQDDETLPKLITVAPSDIMKVHKENCRILNTAVSPNVFCHIKMLPAFEFDKMMEGVVPSSSTSLPGFFAIRSRYGIDSYVAGEAADSYTVESSSDLDSEEHTVECSLVGYRDAANRQEFKQYVNLSGTAPVAFPVAVYHPTLATKDGTTTGFVTFKTDGGDTVCIIPEDQRAAQHVVIEFSSFPADPFDFFLSYKKRPPFMTHDSDVPVYSIGEAHSYLYFDVLERAMIAREDKRVAGVTQLKMEALSKLNMAFHGRGDELETFGWAYDND